MPITIKRISVANPQRRAKRKARAAKARCKTKKRNRRRESNPIVPTLVKLGFINPERKQKNMARSNQKKRRKARNPSRGKRSRSRNPHRRRRGNPQLFATTANTLKLGLAALVGLVAARQLPQMILGARNTGAIGYIANLVAAWATSMLAERFLPGTGQAVMIGGGLYVVNRGLTDYMSPVGKVLSLSGVGDALALGEILTGDRTYMPLPVAYDNNRMPIIPDQIRARPMPVAAAGGGMGYARRRIAM